MDANGDLKDSTIATDGVDTITANIVGDIIDASDNEVLTGTTVASAVNEVTVTNAATGNAPSLAATGDDTNIDLELTSKGTGDVTVNGTPVYGLVILDTPEEIQASSATTGSWVTVNSTTLNTASAVKAIVKVHHKSTNTGTSADTGVYLRKTGSGIANNSATLYGEVTSRSPSSTGLISTGIAITTINLDSSSDFDWYHTASGTGEVIIHLLGYYTR